MPTRARVIENLDWLTEQVSNRIWTTSVGVIALCLTYIVDAGRENSPSFLSVPEAALPATLALLALGFDILQYIAGTRLHEDLLRKMESDNIEEHPFNLKSWPSRCQRFSYRAKLFLCVLSVLLVAGLSIMKIIGMLKVS